MVTTIQEKKEPLTAKVLDMARLVEYQTGSVVSRAVIQKKTGTVTLFAFDEGQGLSEHTAPFDALVCLLDGAAEVIISGNAHVLKKGEMIIMPANEPHALKAMGPFKMMLVMIRGLGKTFTSVLLPWWEEELTQRDALPPGEEGSRT